ncbi:MAG: hypothetical protein K1X36_08525 [Pyrinomonadaceae bacterium]|nr:hypothetical protein [Pyrinomonadaceae bacterium]
MLKRTLLLTFLTLLFAAGALAQQFSIKTDYGYLFVQNDPVRSFTVEIRGKSVKAETESENPAFTIDGILVQIVFADTKDFGAPIKGLPDDRILDIHRKWETDYLSGPFEAQLKVTSAFKTIAGRSANIWSFTRPKFNEEFDRDCFVTVVVGTHVMGLSSPITKSEKLERYTDLLTAIVSTIKLSDKPFDIDELASKFRAKRQIG